MNTELNKVAKCYCLTVNNNMAGFIAILTFPHPIKVYKKVHRLVILPDYQGIGLGTLFLNEIAQLYKNFAITTSQPALIHSLIKNKDWICTRNTRNTRNTGKLAKGLNKTLSNKRITTTFVYKENKNG